MRFSTSPTTKMILVLLSFAALGLSSACVKRQREGRLSNQLTIRAAPQNQTTSKNPAAQRININTASAEELEKLPGIGKGFAMRVVEYREKYGPFRRPEHLIMVRGISDQRFRALRDLITTQ
jgi:competence ComEA-like helix-hairpin-helix protein